jgi:hypothetical protein
MSDAIGPYAVEERIVGGETVWVAIRARGADWSWLTPAEAAHLGQRWVKKYCTDERELICRLVANSACREQDNPPPCLVADPGMPVTTVSTCQMHLR